MGARQVRLGRAPALARRERRRGSAGRCEELECDVVGVAERQPRSVSRVDDTTVGDAEFVQPRFPLGEFGAIGAGKREVIEPDPTFVERFRREIGELMESDQRAADQPDDVAERSRVLIEDRLRAEECFRTKARCASGR